MVTEKQFVEHYEKLYAQKAVYVWGANCQPISKELTDSLYKTFGSRTYNKAYYDAKLREGKGRIAADCSGSALPLSGVDRTAKGYYDDCKQKGSIAALPKNKPCFVFNKNFTHIGAYLGNGYTIEMRSSKMNVWKEKLNKSRWAYYGIPSFVKYGATTSSANKSVKDPIIGFIQNWVNQTYGLSITVDGVFGKNTKAALCKGLQNTINKDFGKTLKVDGVFGSETKKAFPSYTALKKNANIVSILHAILYCKGYDADLVTSAAFTTTYTNGTSELVLKYQQNTRGLLLDGKAGVATFYSLFNS